jgi:hypothetical protein
VPAQAESVEEFYKDKTVNLAIDFSAGGGYELYATPKDVIAKAGDAITI